MKTVSILFLASLAVAVSARTASRELLNVEDDIGKAFSEAKDYSDDARREIDDWFDRFWGMKCISNGQCAEPIAFCDTNEGLGYWQDVRSQECRPNVWGWLILAGIGLVLVGSFVCCIICCLCKCCCCKN